jgi:hypothetical protein
MSIKSIRHRAAAGLIAATAVTGIGVLVAEPALAGVTSAYTHAGSDYSYAEVYVNNGTQGRAYAQHGGAWADSGWWTYYAWARADSGTSNSYYAAWYSRY